MRDIGKVLVLVAVIVAAAGACVQWQKKEDCTQRGGELVRVVRSEYECRDPDVK